MNMVVKVMPLRVVEVTPSDTCQIKSSSRNIQPTAQCSLSSFLRREEPISCEAPPSSMSPVLPTCGAKKRAFHVVHRITVQITSTNVVHVKMPSVTLPFFPLTIVLNG